MVADNKDRHWHSSIYDQLHRIADIALANETPGHSLQPTLLVNDAFMKLLEQQNVDAGDRAQVLAIGANIIRRLLVDYARARKAEKRGGEDGRGFQLQVSMPGNASSIDVVELDDAMEKLAAKRSRAAKVVELKFFGGLTTDEIAQELNVTPKTISNDWRFAKAWLYRNLGNDDSREEVL